MRRKTKRNLLILSYIVLILAIAYLAFLDYRLQNGTRNWSNAYYAMQSLSGIGNFGSTHEHADFAMSINGKKIDFTKPEYQVVHPLVHVEDPDTAPNVIHKHATGVTYGMFFKTIDISVEDCLNVNGKDFCDANGRLVKYYLNGRLTPDLANVEISDLDKVLVSYGSETTSEINAQLAAIPDNACGQSNAC